MNDIVPRKPWIALLMSGVLPGFGQLYNGNVNQAIWLFLTFAVVSVPGIALAALYLPDAWALPALVLSSVVALGLWGFGMAEAWRDAKRKQAYRLERWQISGVYLLVLILCDMLALPALSGYVRAHIVEPFRIPSASMEPTLRRGDFLFADKRYNCPGCKGSIRRGDVAIFTYPNNRTLLYIKRIVALPGDRVRVRGGAVSVNGNALALPATGDASQPTLFEGEDGRRWRVTAAAGEADAPAIDLVVPPGEVFVLGDNRAASADSRKFGTVPMPDVVGRAKLIWLSFGPEGIRLGRLGMRLD